MSYPVTHRGRIALCLLMLDAAIGFAESKHPGAPPNEPLTYDRSLTLEQVPANSANASIADLNSDGHLDILLIKGRHWPDVNRILFGDGSGVFSSAVDLGESADRSYSASVADFDNDGDLDIAISNDRPDANPLYLNDGNGGFTQAGQFGDAEWKTRNAAVADANGDGLPDLIVANRNSRSETASHICLNDAAALFAADCTAFSIGSATTIMPADVNGDGLIDLVVPHRDEGQSYVYIRTNRRSLEYEAVPFGPANVSYRAASAADFDRDGVVDIVTIDAGNSEGGDGLNHRQQNARRVALFFRADDGKYTQTLPLTAATATPYALFVADLNGDELPDILIGHVESPSVAYFNDGSGRRFEPVPFGDGMGTVYGFSVGDLDEDGVLDIAVARSGALNTLHFGAKP